MKILPVNTVYNRKINTATQNKQTEKSSFASNCITPACKVSFKAALPAGDNYFFTLDNETEFKLRFFDFINSRLMEYKTSTDAEDSVYLTDKKVNEAKSGANVSLLGFSSAKTIVSDIADLHNRSSADKVQAQKLYLFDTSDVEKATAKNIILADDSSLSYAKADNVWLTHNSSADKLATEELYQRNDSQSGDIIAKKVCLRDNATANKVKAGDIILKDNSKINYAFVENGTIKLSENASIENLNPENSEIILDKNTRIQTITSDSNIDITGQGTIGDIYTNGTSVILRGPVKLEGKIVFANQQGSVIAQKAPYNIYPKIKNKNVENGMVEFLILNGKEALLGNPREIFEDGIQIATEIIPKEQTDTAPSDLSFWAKHYKTSDPGLSKEITSILNSRDADTARILFTEFYNSTLKTLNSDNETKPFSANFVNNAMIGDENLTDVLFEIINKKPENELEKQELLNNLPTEDRRALTADVVQYWVDEVLPEEINKLNHNTLLAVKDGINCANNYITTLINSPEEAIRMLDFNLFYRKLSNSELNQKNLIDFWIDSTNPQKFYSERLKKEYLTTLLKNPNSRKALIFKTKEALATAQRFLDNYKDACRDILDNEKGISKTERRILETFKNDKNLHDYAFNKTEDKSNKHEIESVILSAISQISGEHEALSLNAHKDIFKKVSHIADLVKSDKNSQLYQYVNFVLSEYGQMTALQSPIEAQDNMYQLITFQKHVENNSMFFEKLWKNILNSSLQFYMTDTLERIDSENLRMLASISRTKPQSAELGLLIEGKYLDRIELKDFVARYRHDPNFVTLMNNDGINKKEVLSDLLTTEAFNNSLYNQRLQRFNEDINPESVAENLDIAEKYLKIMDMDSYSMSLRQKAEAIAALPQEELSLLSSMATDNWQKNELAKFMSDKFVGTQLEYNINAQGKNIKNALSQMCEYLNGINVNIQGQNYTLYELSRNIEKMTELSRESLQELSSIGKNIEAINSNTESTAFNIKAILYSAMQDAKIKDPELVATIKDLLPKSEREPLSEFISKVNIKTQEIKDERRKTQLKSLFKLVLLAVGATGVETVSPDVLTHIFGPGAVSSKAAASLCGVAKTIKHVSIFKSATAGMKKD